MEIREALSAELAEAMRRRDTAVVNALRSALSAAANAGAAPVPEAAGSAPASEHVAGTTPGVGATEVPRVDVTDDQVRAIVAHERLELLGHAERLARLCRRDEADAARRAAESLAAVLGADSSAPGG